MQRLEVSGAVRLIYKSLGVKRLIRLNLFIQDTAVVSKQKFNHLKISPHSTRNCQALLLKASTMPVTAQNATLPTPQRRCWIWAQHKIHFTNNTSVVETDRLAVTNAVAISLFCAGGSVFCSNTDFNTHQIRFRPSVTLARVNVFRREKRLLVSTCPSVRIEQIVYH